MKQDNPNYTRLFDATLDETAPVEGTVDAVGALADYDLLEKIGEGGMGVVWKARKRKSERIVALKQLRFIDAAMDSKQAREAVARFEREIGLTSRLEHPGIARVYETGKDEKSGSPFFTMELVDGEPLTCEGCTIEEKVSLLMLVCDAVAHAHRHGIIHRDLKPANILVTADHAVKILDFGVARALQESEIRSDLFSEDPAMTLSRTGEIFGTPQFMAPEQARGESFLSDTRTDVFALGALLFRLLTGKFPHSDEGGNWEVIARVASGDVQRANEVSEKRIPADLEAVLMKALAFAPDDRYSSVGDLRTDLGNFLKGEPVVAQPLSAAYWFKRHVTRHSTEWFGGLVIFLAMISFGVAWEHERSRHLKEQVELLEKAKAGERSAKEAQSKSFVRIARDYRESGAKAKALPYLAQAIKLDPDNRIARASLAAAMKQFPNFSRASPTVRFPGVAKEVLFDPLGNWYVVAIHGVGIHFFDSETHSLIREIPADGKVIDMQIAPGKSGGLAVAFRDLDKADETHKNSGSMVFVAPVDGVVSRQDTPTVVSSFGFSPDGRFMVQGFGRNGELQGGFNVVDLSDFTRPTVIARHFFTLPEGISPGVGWAADRQSVYFTNGEPDGRLHRFDLESGESVRTSMMARPPGARPYPLRNFTVSRDGRIAVSGGGRHLSMWRDDAGSGPELLWSDEGGPAGTIRDCRFSADERYLSGSSRRGQVIVWSVDTGERLASLEHGEPVLSVHFSPDPESTLLLTRSGTDRYRLWDWRKGVETGHPLEGGQRVLAAAFSPDGKTILVGGHQHARMWGVVPRSWDPVILDCGVPVNAIRIDSDRNRILATSYPAGKAILLSIPTGARLREWRHEAIYSHPRTVHRFPAEMSAGGRYVATAETAKEVVVRGGVDFSEIRISLPTTATALAFHPADEMTLAIGDAAAKTTLYRLDDSRSPESSSIIQTMKGAGVHPWEYFQDKDAKKGSENPYHNYVGQLSFASVDDRLVSVEFPRGVYTVFDWKEGMVVGNRWITGIPVTNLKITPDGRFGVMAGDALFSRIISLKDAKFFGPGRHHSSVIRKLGIGADSKRFASASVDGQVKFWDIESTGENEPVVIPPQEAPITAMACSSDGFLCATGDTEGRIKLWLMKNGEPLCDPLDAGAAINDLVFHEKYPLLVAACNDGRIRLWEIPAGKGRCTDEFATLAETMAGLLLTEAGETKVGATYQYDQMKASFYRRYQDQVRERELNPAYRTDEYHRIADEIFGFPAITEPEWVLQGD